MAGRVDSRAIHAAKLLGSRGLVVVSAADMAGMLQKSLVVEV